MSILQRLLIAVIALAGLFMLAAETSAHEATLGVIEFKEVRPGSYVGRWTMEPEIGAKNVDLQLPRQCFFQLPQLNCGTKGLVGSITIGNLGSKLSAVLVKVIPLSGEPRSYTITSTNPVVSILGADAATIDAWLDLAVSYVNLGIDHILLGADHLLFVLGLIWIVRGAWPLAKTITAFTIGHSISLAAATFGFIGIAERPLNACIALSIAFVAIEMVNDHRGISGLTARYPWAVAGIFGLVHGVGFASALSNLGIERRLLPAALLFFNIGVEIGQLAFVFLVLALAWSHRRLGAELPGWGNLLPSYAIGSVATYWFIGRMVRVLVVP